MTSILQKTVLFLTDVWTTASGLHIETGIFSFSCLRSNEKAGLRQTRSEELFCPKKEKSPSICIIANRQATVIRSFLSV
ncbi:MAG: hypothetical protein IJ418_05645 [Clostridia bacterium]|nr:hypothetical protein [Clostridia bacterium]